MPAPFCLDFPAAFMRLGSMPQSARERTTSAPLPGSAVRIVSTGLALAAVGIYLRYCALIYDAPSPWADIGLRLRTALVMSQVDLALCLGLTIAFLVLDRLCSHSSRLAWVFLGLAALIVILETVNIVAIHVLSGPLTVPWIAQADMFRSFTPRSVVEPFLTLQLGGLFASALIALVLGRRAAEALLRRLQNRGVLRSAGGGFVGLLGAYFGLMVVNPVEQTKMDAVRSPVLELIRSGMSYNATLFEDPGAAIMPPTLPPPQNPASRIPPGLAGNVRNIVVVVMESVGARQLTGVGAGGAHAWTPQLSKVAGHTLAFRNVYTHTPDSTKSLFAIVTGYHPRFSYVPETELVDWPHVTVAARMRAAGARTALFMSGDLRYQGVDTFLQGKGFDTLADGESIPCRVAPSRAKAPRWKFSDAVDDQCSVRALSNWIDADPGRPFFAILWTGDTHWPYFPPEALPTRTDDHRGRYKAAIQGSDAAIGRLLDFLKVRGLDRSTLVVVTGDHGEAFREHSSGVHGNTIFDEEVAIPLLMIHPAISGPSTIATLGGLVDLAPTLLHVRGDSAEPSWQGRSLFDPNRAGQVMMFSTRREMTIGFREGSRKYVYMPGRDLTRSYDLARYPGEQHPLVPDPATRSRIQARIAGLYWQNGKGFPDGKRQTPPDQ